MNIRSPKFFLITFYILISFKVFFWQIGQFSSSKLFVHTYVWSIPNKSWAPRGLSLSCSSLYSPIDITQCCQILYSANICANDQTAQMYLKLTQVHVFLFINLFCPSPWLVQASWFYYISKGIHIIYQFIHSKDKDTNVCHT